jgi:hypothetical protein
MGTEILLVDIEVLNIPLFDSSTKSRRRNQTIVKVATCLELNSQITEPPSISPILVSAIAPRNRKLKLAIRARTKTGEVNLSSWKPNLRTRRVRRSEYRFDGFLIVSIDEAFPGWKPMEYETLVVFVEGKMWRGSPISRRR